MRGCNETVSNDFESEGMPLNSKLKSPRSAAAGNMISQRPSMLELPFFLAQESMPCVGAMHHTTTAAVQKKVPLMCQVEL